MVCLHRPRLLAFAAPNLATAFDCTCRFVFLFPGRVIIFLRYATFLAVLSTGADFSCTSFRLREFASARGLCFDVYWIPTLA